MPTAETAELNGTISRTLTILSGATTSNALDLRYMRNSTAALSGQLPVLTLQMPAAFTGATVSFSVSCDNGTTYQTLYDDNGNVVSVAVAASRTISCPSLGAVDLVKLVSASSEGADRSIVVKAGAGSPAIQRAAGGSGGTVTVSQLPSSAALADATANPTTTLIGAMNEVFNGTTWDRVRSATADALASTGLAAAALMGWNGATWDRLKTFATGFLHVWGGGNTAIENGVTSVTTSATLLPASALANRKNVTVYNAGTQTVYLGKSDVTADTTAATGGLQLLAGQTLSFDLGPSVSLYGIVAATTANVCVFEVS